MVGEIAYDCSLHRRESEAENARYENKILRSRKGDLSVAADGPGRADIVKLPANVKVSDGVWWPKNPRSKLIHIATQQSQVGG